eukprot:1172861-Amphidinium_carterae.1
MSRGSSSVTIGPSQEIVKTLEPDFVRGMISSIVASSAALLSVQKRLELLPKGKLEQITSGQMVMLVLNLGVVGDGVR